MNQYRFYRLRLCQYCLHWLWLRQYRLRVRYC